MPEVLGRLDGAIGGMQLVLPCPEIGLLRKPARRAQLVEDRAVRGPLVQEFGRKPPQCSIRRIVERQPMIRAENGDRRRKLVQRAPMRVDGARELGAGGLDLGDVDADPRAAMAKGFSCGGASIRSVSLSKKEEKTPVMEMKMAHIMGFRVVLNVSETF